MDPKQERSKFLNRLRLLEKLRVIDRRGYVLLNEKYKPKRWINCKSCKFFKPDGRAENDGYFPMACPVRSKGKKDINIAPEPNTGKLWWICTNHQFSEEYLTSHSTNE